MPDAASAAAAAQEIELLAAAVDSLPARCREIFILRRLRGVPQREIAARLGLSEQTVQVQAARGLRRSSGEIHDAPAGPPMSAARHSPIASAARGSDAAVEAAASVWLMRRKAGMNLAEQRELEAWLEADPRHPGIHLARWKRAHLGCF